MGCVKKTLSFPDILANSLPFTNLLTYNQRYGGIYNTYATNIHRNNPLSSFILQNLLTKHRRACSQPHTSKTEARKAHLRLMLVWKQAQLS